MKNFQAKKIPRQNYLHRGLIIVGLLIITVILAKAVWDIYFKNQLAEQNRAATARELSNLETRQAKLAFEVEKLKTDQGLDETIRNNFSVVKEGEKVITIVIGDDNEANNTTAMPTSTPSWWSRIWSKI